MANGVGKSRPSAWPPLHERLDGRLGREQEIPAWATALAELGAWVVEQRAQGKQILGVLVVPTRSYSSLWVALGAILASHQTVPDQFDLAPGTKVTCITQKSRLAKGVVEGPYEGCPSLYWVNLGKSRDALPRKQLFATERPLSLERALIALRVMGFLGHVGVRASIDSWLERPDSILLAGSKEKLLEEATRLEFRVGGAPFSLRELLLINSDASGFGMLTRVSPHTTETLPARALVAILDGPEPLGLLEYDEDHPTRGLARTGLTTLLLLTEDEYAREKRRVANCISSWGGRVVDREAIGGLGQGLAGAGLHCLVKDIRG